MRSSYQREFNFVKYLESVVEADTIKYTGRVVAVRGLDIESEGPRSVIGEICTIKLSSGASILAEVVGLDGKTVKLTAFSASWNCCVIAFQTVTCLLPAANSA